LNFKTIRLIAAGMLIFAIIDLPYGVNSTTKCNSRRVLINEQEVVIFVPLNLSQLRSTYEALQPSYSRAKIRNLFVD